MNKVFFYTNTRPERYKYHYRVQYHSNEFNWQFSFGTWHFLQHFGAFSLNTLEPWWIIFSIIHLRLMRLMNYSQISPDFSTISPDVSPVFPGFLPIFVGSEAPRGSSARRPPREKRSAVPLPELRSQSQPAKRCERPNMVGDGGKSPWFMVDLMGIYSFFMGFWWNLWWIFKWDFNCGILMGFYGRSKGNLWDFMGLWKSLLYENL